MEIEKKILLNDVSNLIEQSKINVAIAVNTELSMLYWNIGKRIKTTIKKHKILQFN